MPTNRLTAIAFLKDEYTRTMGRIDASTKKGLRSIESMGDSLLYLGGAFAGLQLGRFTMEAVQMAARSEDVARSFETMATAAGQSSDELLAAMQKASRGSVTSSELMIGANRAQALAGKEALAELPRIMEVARAASLAMGIDVNYAIESAITGLGRLENRWIDNLGFTVDFTKANEAMAASLGKTVDVLTDEEKKLAAVAEFIEKGESAFGDLIGSATTATEEIQNFAVAADEAKVAFGDLVIELGAVTAMSDLNEGLKRNTEDMKEFNKTVEVVGLGGAIKAWGEMHLEQLKLHASFLLGKTSAEEFDAALEENANIMEHATGVANSLELAVRDLAVTYDGYQAAVRRANAATAEGADEIAQSTSDAIIGYETVTDRIITARRDIRRANRAAQEEEERDRAAYLENMQREYERTYDRLASQVQSVLTSGLSVTQADFALEAAGMREIAPLESVRRLNDIVNRGLESPWASYFEIPPEILAAGTAAIKAWAAQTAEEASAGRRIDLIDKDAFLREFQEMKDAQAQEEATTQVLIKWVTDAGLVDSPAAAREQLDTMLGKTDAGGMLRDQWTASVEAQLPGFYTMGETLGDTVYDGFISQFLDRWNDGDIPAGMVDDLTDNANANAGGSAGAGAGNPGANQ